MSYNSNEKQTHGWDTRHKYIPIRHLDLYTNE